MKLPQLITFTTALFAIDANAASFNCDNARTTVEVLICSDTELSSLDEKVGDSYNSARVLASKDGIVKSRLLEDQRQFLKQRNTACPIPLIEEIPEEESIEIITCLKEQYILRFSALETQIEDFRKQAINVPLAQTSPAAGLQQYSFSAPTPTPAPAFVPTPAPTVQRALQPASDWKVVSQVQSAPKASPQTYTPPVTSSRPVAHNTTRSSDGSGVWIIICVIAGWLYLSSRDKKSSKPSSQTTATNTKTNDYSPTVSANQPSSKGITVSLSTGSSRTSANINAKWIKDGEAITVAGHTITGGYVYFDSGKVASSASSDCAVIIAGLPVAEHNPDTIGTYMGYWPSYSAIQPECRLAYLEWLKTSKDNPTTYIGYVFLYFYSLERRIIIDKPPNEEMATLMREVARLQSIYGGNSSFYRYSSQLLEIAGFIIACRQKNGFLSVLPWLKSESPPERMTQMVALAFKLQNASTVPFEWAILGFCIASGENFSTVEKRVHNDFLSLMRKRFEKKWPQGYSSRFRKDASKLTYAYRGASSSLYIPDVLEHMGVKALLDPQAYIWTALVNMAKQAQEDLASYSHALGRNATIEGSIEAVGLLPPEMAQEHLKTLEGKIVPWLTSKANPLLRVSFAELTERITGKSSSGSELAKIRNYADVLARMGYGLEPDPDFVRFYNKVGDTAVIFDARSFKDLRKASASYPLAVAIVTLVAGITGASENGLGEAEIRWLGWIKKTLNLAEGEFVRLRAHLEWLTLQKLSMAQIKRALAEIPLNQRDTIARFAAAVVAADGVIEKSEVAFLEKVYDELGVDRTRLYGTLHDIAAEQAMPADTPVSVQTGKESEGRGYKIKQPSVPTPQLVVNTPKPKGLNMKKINKIIEETKQVSSILTEVFSETDETPQTSIQDPSKEEATFDIRFAGLDNTHATLLARLVSHRDCKRIEFEKLARELGLMPDGALEVINEWSFDNFDEAFIEDGDILEIKSELLKAAA